MVEIKRLQQEKVIEQKEFQAENIEKQKMVQTLKDKLIYKTNRCDVLYAF